jgi:hypothetical protein
MNQIFLTALILDKVELDSHFVLKANFLDTRQKSQKQNNLIYIFVWKASSKGVNSIEIGKKILFEGSLRSKKNSNKFFLSSEKFYEILT